jgi:hypothetical protein
MDALRNSKKISLLAVAILFLFTFFNLILHAPRRYTVERNHGSVTLPYMIEIFIDQYRGHNKRKR